MLFTGNPVRCLWPCWGPGHGRWLLLQLGHSWTSSFVLEVVVTFWEADRSQGKAQENTLAFGMTCWPMCFLLVKSFFNLLLW